MRRGWRPATAASFGDANAGTGRADANTAAWRTAGAHADAYPDTAAGTSGWLADGTSGWLADGSACRADTNGGRCDADAASRRGPDALSDTDGSSGVGYADGRGGDHDRRRRDGNRYAESDGGRG